MSRWLAAALVLLITGCGVKAAPRPVPSSSAPSSGTGSAGTGSAQTGTGSQAK